MEVSSTKHHSIPGQAGVTGGEAQARLPDPVLPLRGGAEQGGVPRAGPVRHVHWPGPVATFAILNQLKDFLITLAHDSWVYIFLKNPYLSKVRFMRCF